MVRAVQPNALSRKALRGIYYQSVTFTQYSGHPRWRARRPSILHPDVLATGQGRVVRLFLTSQDRLVKALRLAGINDLVAGVLLGRAQHALCRERAQRPMHTARLPAHPQELARICALHYNRTLNAMCNCQFQGQLLRRSGQVADITRLHIPRGRRRA